MDNQNIQQFILGELRRSGRTIIIDKQERHIKILCPYHNDHNPSLHLTLKHHKFFPGVFYCPVCKASGGWNKLAETLHLTLLTKKKVAEVDPFFHLTQQLASPVSNIMKLPKGIVEWRHGNWRGLSEKFLARIGAYRWWDNKCDAYRILLPVRANSELKGWIGARLDNKVEPKYWNAPGEWAKSTWLGIEYLDNLNKIWNRYDCKSVALVEGPYDALRCWYNKIPALAMLGTGNYSSVKKAQLVSLGIEKIILFFDGDEAGKEATRFVYGKLKDTFKVRQYKLPTFRKKEDQLDPGNCPVNYLDEVKELLYVR